MQPNIKQINLIYLKKAKNKEKTLIIKINI